MTTRPTIRELKQHEGQKVTLNGWVYNKRSSGKVRFLILRDGTGYLQCVAFVKDVSPEVFDLCDRVNLESSVSVDGHGAAGRARARRRGALPLGTVTLHHMAEEYPIQKKDHGTAFLMENRHLWLRSSRQVAILRTRSEIEQSFRDYFYTNGFTLIDSPILTPAACEGTTTLFETEYFGEKAYLEPVGPALPRARVHGPRQGLLLRPHLPRREEQDPAPPHRVLDARARGGLRGAGRRHGPRRGLPRLRGVAASWTAARRS